MIWAQRVAKPLISGSVNNFVMYFFFITKAIGLPQFCEDGTSLKRGLGIITQKLEDDIHIWWSVFNVFIIYCFYYDTKKWHTKVNVINIRWHKFTIMNVINPPNFRKDGHFMTYKNVCHSLVYVKVHFSLKTYFLVVFVPTSILFILYNLQYKILMTQYLHVKVLNLPLFPNPKWKK